MELDRSTIAVSSEYFIEIVFSIPVRSFLHRVKVTGDKPYMCGMLVEMDRSPDNAPIDEIKTSCCSLCLFMGSLVFSSEHIFKEFCFSLQQVMEVGGAQLARIITVDCRLAITAFVVWYFATTFVWLQSLSTYSYCVKLSYYGQYYTFY